MPAGGPGVSWSMKYSDDSFCHLCFGDKSQSLINVYSPEVKSLTSGNISDARFTYDVDVHRCSYGEMRGYRKVLGGGRRK